MGVPYNQLVGEPPAITSQAHRIWRANLLIGRLAECPISRTTTYYFSPTGNDANTGLSPASPKQTTAAAQTIINAAANPANIALLFEGGKLNVFSGTELTINKANITIGSYNGGRALFSLYTDINGADIQTYYDRGDTYRRTYSIALGGTEVADVNVKGCQSDPWLQVRGGATIPLMIQDVDDHPGSFFHDTVNSVLYFHDTEDAPPTLDKYATACTATVLAATTIQLAIPWGLSLFPGQSIRLTGATPENAVVQSYNAGTGVVTVTAPLTQAGNTLAIFNDGLTSYRTYQYAVQNTTRFASISDVDGTRFDSLALYGFGVQADTTKRATYAVKGAISGTNAFLMSNCDVFMSDNHCLGPLAPGGGGSGGIITYLNCRAGGCTWPDSPWVSYADYGGMEVIMWGNTCPNAQRPSRQYTPQPQPNFTHSNPIGSIGGLFYTVGTTTCQLDGNAGAWLTDPFYAGMIVKMIGGTPETLTVQSYSRTTGVVTFTTPITQAGHTGFEIGAGRGIGEVVSWPAKLLLYVDNRVPAGAIQCSTGFTFTSVAKPYPDSDLTLCRAFSVGEVVQATPPTTKHRDVRSLPISGQTLTTVTLTNAFPGRTGTLAGQKALLVGGSAPEIIKILGIAGNVISTIDTINNAGHTNIILECWGFPNQYNVAGIAPSCSSFVQYDGCFWQARGVIRPDKNSTVTLAYNPLQSAIFHNCTVIGDFSACADTLGAGGRFLFNSDSGQGYGADFNACQFHLIGRGVDILSVDYRPYVGAGNGKHRYYNTYFSYDVAQGNTVYLGTNNTAAGMRNCGVPKGVLFTNTGLTGSDLGTLIFATPADAPVPGLRPMNDTDLIVSPANWQTNVGMLDHDATGADRNPASPVVGPLVVNSNTGSVPASTDWYQTTVIPQ